MPHSLLDAAKNSKYEVLKIVNGELDKINVKELMDACKQNTHLKTFSIHSLSNKNAETITSILAECSHIKNLFLNCDSSTLDRLFLKVGTITALYLSSRIDERGCNSVMDFLKKNKTVNHLIFSFTNINIIKSLLSHVNEFENITQISFENFNDVTTIADSLKEELLTLSDKITVFICGMPNQVPPFKELATIGHFHLRVKDRNSNHNKHEANISQPTLMQSDPSSASMQLQLVGLKKENERLKGELKHKNAEIIMLLEFISQNMKPNKRDEIPTATNRQPVQPASSSILPTPSQPPMTSLPMSSYSQLWTQNLGAPEVPSQPNLPPLIFPAVSFPSVTSPQNAQQDSTKRPRPNNWSPGFHETTQRRGMDASFEGQPLKDDASPRKQ